VFNVKKRILSFALVILFSICLVPSVVFATETDDDIVLTILDEDEKPFTGTVTWYSVEVEDEVDEDGEPVYEVASESINVKSEYKRSELSEAAKVIYCLGSEGESLNVQLQKNITVSTSNLDILLQNDAGQLCIPSNEVGFILPGSVSFDLNGYTITATNKTEESCTDHTHTHTLIASFGTSTVKNGTIKVASNNILAFFQAGKNYPFTIQNVTLTTDDGVTGVVGVGERADSINAVEVSLKNCVMKLGNENTLFRTDSSSSTLNQITIVSGCYEGSDASSIPTSSSDTSGVVIADGSVKLETNPADVTGTVITSSATTAMIVKNGTAYLYDTLQDAVDAVEDGETITLLQATSEEVKVDRALTVIPASEGVSFTGKVTGSNSCVTSKDAAYTIQSHALKEIKAKAATYTDEGNIAYLKCDYCGKLYLNTEDGTKEIQEDDVKIEKLVSAPTTTTTTPSTTVTTNPDGTKTETTTKTEGNVTTSTATNKDADGNVTGSTETKEEKKSDGSTVTTETKKDADGKVTQKTETTVAKDTTTNTTTETTKTENADGTKTTETVKTVDENNKVLSETTKETEIDKEAEKQKEVLTEKKEDGSVVKTTTTSSTNADDLSKTIVEEKAAENSKGSTVEQTTTTVIDTTGKTTSVTEEHKIDNVGNSTNAVITVAKDGDGNVQEATAEVEKTGATKENGVQATFTNKVVSQLKEAAGDAAKDLTITMTVKDENGDDHHSITAKVDDLTPNNTLYIYKQDENGNYIMVNAKEYTTDAKGQLKTTIKSKNDFVLLNEQEANAATKAVLSTVKASKTTASVKKSKTTTMKLDSGLNMANVKSVVYKTSKSSVATVDKKTGKITAKKAGKATVSAVVTLKNGKTKTVKMTINVK
jgi:hypothetical protein